jgi:hypothetical protein
MASDVFVSLPDGRWHIDKIVAKLQQRIALLEGDQVRLFNFIETSVALNNTRGELIDLLRERVTRLERKVS